MTPEHLAAKLLAGCPPGPVYEYLLTAAGKQAAKTVTVAPTEDETTWALLRGLDVDTACRLISLITSPELLHRILAMARRKNVRRAIAANPHLTDADVTTLAHEAALADKALAQALYEGRTPAGQVKLLLDHPQLGNYLDNVDGSFACAVYNSADDTVLRSIVGNPRRSATLETLDMVCGFSNEPRFGVPAVIEVAFALNLTKDEHVRDRVATYVCRNATDAELLGALAKLDWPTLRFAAAMARPHLVAGTVLGRAATGDELLQLAGKLSYGKIEIGVDVARKLAAHELPLCGWHRQLRLSSAGHDAFLTAVSDDVAVWFALQHPDPERRAEVLAARLNLSRVTIRRLELTVNLLLRLLDDGPVEAALGERAWVVLSSWWAQHRREEPPLVDAVITRGPVDLIERVTLTDEHVVRLLDRADLRTSGEEAVEVWANALKVDGLTAEQRQQVLTYLPADELAHCLLRLHDGELRWALTRHPARAKLATLVAGQGLPLAKQAWMADIVELLPLAWPTSLRQPPVAVATRMYLTRRFGDDISRWETALSLLTGWEDTLTRLADTVDLLTTQ